MNPPPLAERRGVVAPEGRRRDDKSLHDIAHIIQRAYRAIMGIAALVGVGVALVAWLQRPARAMSQTINARIDTVSAKTDRNYLANRSMIEGAQTRIDAIEEVVRLNTYIQCVALRRTDPAAVPPECNEVVLRHRGGPRAGGIP